MGQQSVAGRYAARAFQFESGNIETRIDLELGCVVQNIVASGSTMTQRLKKRGGAAANQRSAGD